MPALTASARHRRGARPLAGRLPPHVRSWALVLFLALAAIATTTYPAQAEEQKATQFTLGNGMQVLVVPNHRVPIVTLELWYKSGASEDPEGQTGLAHFLEHLMFKGTDRYPDNTIERYSVANGGIGVNAATSHDYTVYRQNLPKQHLAKLLDMEADRMVNLQLKEEHIAPELGAVQNERRGNENSPSYLWYDRIYAALYPGHPYGRSVIGTTEQIATLDRAKAIAFYKRHYAPNNAILVVAGDVTDGEVRTLTERTFGRIPAKADLPPHITQALPPHPATRRVDMEHERVATPSVGFFFLTPGVGALPQADAVALNQLTQVAGQSMVGRLFRSLIIDKRLATGVSASYTFQRQSGLLSFTATAAPGISVTDLETALAREVTALGRDGVTAAEADAARQQYLASKAYSDDNHQRRANAYGSAMVRGLTVSDVDAMDGIVERLTAADINRVAARFIAKGEPVVGVLRPRAVRQASDPKTAR